MNVAIVEYNAGNVQSVSYALNRLGIEPVVTAEPEQLLKADKVIFPGVGEARTAMQFLKARGLDQLICQLQQPVLGVCLGLQLMCRHTEENNTDCLNIFDLAVKRFPPNNKVPQMGWNRIMELEGPLFTGVPQQSYTYFVHSYYAELGKQTIAQTDYQLNFSAALHTKNFYAVQFHPEKSSEVGSQILQNFLELI